MFAPSAVTALALAAVAGAAAAQPVGVRPGSAVLQAAKPPARPAGANLAVPLSPTHQLSPAVTPTAPLPHGSWTRRAGTYSFTICKAGAQTGACDIVLSAGASLPVAIQVWGAGGGGAGGEGGGGACARCGGMSGGGGGGGGYASLTKTVLAPANGPSVWTVTVGTGGTAGQKSTDPWNSSVSASLAGGDGVTSSVVADGIGGPVIVSATGGIGGNPHMTVNNQVRPIPGAPGTGSVGGWTGTRGYVSGSSGGACGGAAGALGGAGGGPGRTGPGYFNDGGDGGHGGYAHTLGCLAESKNHLLTDGSRGGDGKVTLTW
jgi:hypothetical protein